MHHVGVSCSAAGKRATNQVLKTSLLSLVLGPRKKARKDRGLGLDKWSFGEPHPQRSLSVSATPTNLGSVTDLGAGEPAFDHAHGAASWVARAALSALPGT